MGVHLKVESSATRCSVCGAKAITRLSYAKLYLCSDHFLHFFESRVLGSIQAMGMFQRGERVVVAVSGGKDSLSLLHFLSKFKDLLGIDLIAVLIDEGIRGYRSEKIAAARFYARLWGVELVVKSFEEEFGLTLDEAVRRLMHKGLIYKPCTVCGVFRRYLLNKACLELGADKLATAHNLDDEVQAFLMNAAQANFQAILREGVVAARTHPLLVPRVKPFYFIPEREVLIYALIQKIETPDVECPYIVYSFRHTLRRWLNRVAEEDPSVKHRALSLKIALSKRYQLEASEELKMCKLCGMPSSRDICKACQLREYLSRP
ncbi:MAG: TIGR00269 family protein [Thermofilaceae archaeon]